jgi:pimeloyl-ACP methyl ester carboxylesterase
MNADIREGLLPSDTIFIHGNLASNRWWEPAAEIWSRRSSRGSGRMICAEWRGFGGTDAPATEEELHPSIIASDYVALARSMGLKRANIVGHSTGGLIALLAAAQEPSLFGRLLLLDPVAPTGIQFDDSMYAAFDQMSVDPQLTATVIGGTILNNNPDSEFFRLLARDAFHIAKPNWRGVLRNLKTLDVRPQVATVQNQTLVLHGEHDVLLPREGSEALARLLPNGRFEVVKGQGHCANVENPELFVRLVDEFLL